MKIDIRTIDDVLPHIGEDNGIIVSRRPDHTVIDYVFTTDDTFNSDMALQCRGLKFDAEGRIIARPFHKFFNLGEREDPGQVDWSRAHHVLDKLDGTMLHAARLGDDLVFMTRMGVTDQARAAADHADDALMGFCAAQLDAGRTPLFEYTAPDNRIVVAYDKPQITLLAVRDTVSGQYMPDGDLRDLGKRFGLAVTGHNGQVADIRDFMTRARALEDVEGYVIAFDDGHRIKLKADAYVLRHRALSNAHLEKSVLAWSVNDAVDDVVPLLNGDIADRVVAYHKDVNAALARREREVLAFAERHKGQDRRDYATAVRTELEKTLHPAAFALLDGKDVRGFLKKHLIWAASSQSRIDQVRDLYGLSWSADGLARIEPG